MKSNTFYGEYSLKHWVDLIKSKNILLPEYQRSFVWNKEQVENFIKALKEGQFIPPVIIGAYKSMNENKNYIIDGQQRLTSILLASLGKFPKTTDRNKGSFVSSDDVRDDEDEKKDIGIKWTFKNLVDEYDTQEEYLNSNYIQLNSCISEDEFDKIYLGFSFVVPECNENEIQGFFCSMFRNINLGGVTLSNRETRESLYYWDSSKRDFFKCAVLDDFKIQKQTGNLDFLRYISILSQYKKENNFGAILKKYSPFAKNEERYYSDYIYEVIEKKEGGPKKFVDFNSIFDNGNYKDKLKKLEKQISALCFDKELESIVNADITFFGLFYQVLFENKEINIEKSREIKDKIKVVCDAIRNSPSSSKNPNQLSFIRERVEKSCELYSAFVGGR